MARIIGLLVLFLAALTLGGCAGMPLDLNGYANGASGYGYAAPCPQPYAGGIGCAPPPSVVYVPQPQPYYVPQPYAYDYNSPAVYAPAPPPGVEHRIHEGWRDGPLPPREARRQWAEQRHLRGPEGRMRADGNLSPYERERLDARQNRPNQDIYHGRHNGVAQPGNGPVGPGHPMVQRGGPVPQPGNGPAGPMGSRGQSGPHMVQPDNSHAGPMGSGRQPQNHGAQMQGPTQAGVASGKSIAATPGQ